MLAAPIPHVQRAWIQWRPYSVDDLSSRTK